MNETNETFAVTFSRTKEWLYQERLKTGRNVPDQFTVQVDPAALTPEARTVWLNSSCNKCYENLKTIGYRQDYTTTVNYCGWGNVDLVINSYQPTPDQISDAILAAKLKVELLKLERSDEISRLKNKLAKLTSVNEKNP